MLERYAAAAVKGLIVGLFSVAGPMAVLLDAAERAGLTFAETMVWMAGSYGVCGLFTILLAWRTRLPVIIAWSIPGAVLIGSVMSHYEFSEMIFAYIATAVLVLVSGWLGLGDRLLAILPPAIVMGMLSGVLFPFLIRVPELILNDPLVSGVPVLAFFLVGIIPVLRRRVPPILAAALAGVFFLLLFRGQEWNLVWRGFNVPQLFLPQLSGSVLLDVSLPIFLFIVGVNHIQAVSLLKEFQYSVVGRQLNAWVGYTGLTASFLGGSPVSLAGTLMSILAPSKNDRREDLWFGAFVFGFLFLFIAAFAPLVVQLRGLLPADLLGTLAGLALLPVIAQTMRTAVGEVSRSPAGLVAFCVTLSGIEALGLNAPLWGLLSGFAIHGLALYQEKLSANSSSVSKQTSR